MDLFSWLLVGHLVGDWLLQNKWMAEGKRHGVFARALLIHCLIYTGAIGVAIFFGASVPDTQSGERAHLPIVFGGVAVAIFASHWLIDGFDLACRWGQLLRQNDSPLVRMGVDQTLHIVVLAAVVQRLGS